MAVVKILIRLALTVLMVVAAVFAGRALWQRYEIDPWTRDGRVRADVVQVTPDVAGLVTQVHVHDNQSVRRGELLFVLDRPRYELALAQAQAALATQRVLLAQAIREDRRNLALSDLVTTEATEEGRSRVAQLQAAVSTAVASEGVARLNLDRTLVRASVDGAVSNLELRPGDYLAAGHAAMALIDAGSLHVDGYFEETKLGGVHVGDRVEVRLMGVPAPIYGRVESVASGVEDRERSSSSDLLANVNPTFSWVRLAQRIPVRVKLDGPPSNVAMIIGRTATVTVVGAHYAAGRKL